MAPTTAGKTPLIDSVFSLLSRPQAAHLAVLPASVAHPLDPLTAGEITAAGKAVREHAQKLSIKAIRFNAITLQVTAHHDINMHIGMSLNGNEGIEHWLRTNLGTCDLPVPRPPLWVYSAAADVLSIHVCLQEPPKAALLEYEASGRRNPPPRRAFCIVQLPSLPGSCVAEALVDLSQSSPAVLQWNKVGMRGLWN